MTKFMHWLRSLAQSPYTLPGVILLIGFIISLYGLDYGLPYVDSDEKHSVANAGRMLAARDPNPHWFAWPGTTIMYLLCVIYIAIFLVGLVLGIFKNTADFQSLYYQDPTVFYLSGRILMVVFSLVAVFFTYLVARRMFSRSVAILAAVFTMLSPLYFQFSRVIRPEPLMALLLLIVFWYSLNILERRAWRDYILAGIFTGLAIATKYPSAVVGAVIMLAHFASAPSLRSDFLKLFASFLACLGGVFLGSPFLFFSFAQVVSHLQLSVPAEHLGATGEGFIRNLIWYLQQPLTYGLTLTGLGLAIFGGILCIGSRDKAKWALVPFPILFTMLLAAMTVRWERWIVPAIPFLCILAAFSIDWISRKIQVYTKPFAAHLLLIAVSAWIALPMFQSDLSRVVSQASHDSNIIAQTWILNNISPHSRILVERYTPPLPKGKYMLFYITDRQVTELPGEEKRSIITPRGKIGELKDMREVIEHGIQYMIVNGRFYNLYSAAKERYSEQVATYDQLMQMSTKIYEVRPTSDTGVFRGVTVYRFDEATRK